MSICSCCYKTGNLLRCSWYVVHGIFLYCSSCDSGFILPKWRWQQHTGNWYKPIALIFVFVTSVTWPIGLKKTGPLPTKHFKTVTIHFWMQDSWLFPSVLFQYGLNMCKGTEPVAAQCQRVDTKEPPSQVLAVDCTPTGGLLCFNSDQPNNETCHNYEIRFKCLSSRGEFLLYQLACLAKFLFFEFEFLPMWTCIHIFW